MRRWLYYVCPVGLYVWLARRHLERFKLTAITPGDSFEFVAPEPDVWVLIERPNWKVEKEATKQSQACNSEWQQCSEDGLECMCKP